MNIQCGKSTQDGKENTTQSSYARWPVPVTHAYSYVIGVVAMQSDYAVSFLFRNHNHGLI